MEKWEREKEPVLFRIVDFVDKIELTDNTLYHLENTNKEFNNYLNILGKYCDYDSYTMIYYWLDQARKEAISSGEIEKHKFSFSNEELLNGDLFFDKLNVSEKRIKDIHKFVSSHSSLTNGSSGGEYRTNPCWVGYYQEDGTPYVFWKGAKPEDIKPFMKSFLEFYKRNNLRDLYTNPFLKSALAQMLFIKIHPFEDGNGRTSRILHNISFTSSLNKIYGTNLKLAPLNISENIYLNQKTYVNILDNINFDINWENNEQINNWFNFILNMYDEQLYFQNNRIPKLVKCFDNIKKVPLEEPRVINEVNKSKLKKLF